MDLALLFSAVLLGLSGAPHCAAMCAAPCAAASGRPGGAGVWTFQLGRGLSYAVAGAVVASSVGLLASMGQAVAALRPLWTLVHIAALALGVYLLWRGRQPAWLESLGRGGGPEAGGFQHRGEGGWQRMQGPARSAVAGLAWVAWPCGLLQSALLMAALANTAAGGAMVMGGFAVASSMGLLAGPALWARWLGAGAGTAATRLAAGATLPVRLGGGVLAAASTWALGHDLFVRFAAWCIS